MHDKKHIMDRLYDCGLIPVIRTDDKHQAMALAEALFDGGLATIEVTMTVPGVLRIIEDLRKLFGDKALIGAGTVLDADTARMAILAGAEYIVTPCLDEETITLCNRYSKPAVPGAMTPTEILKAWSLGADLIKVFPADLVGGPKYIEALKGPLPQVAVMPSGGVTLDNAVDFMRAGANILSVGGGLIDRSIIKRMDYQALTRRTETFVKLIAETRTLLNEGRFQAAGEDCQ